MCLPTVPQAAGRSRNTPQELYPGARNLDGGSAWAAQIPATGAPRDGMTFLSATRADQSPTDRITAPAPEAAAPLPPSQVGVPSDNGVAVGPPLPRRKPATTKAHARSAPRLAGSSVPGPARTAGVSSGGILMRPAAERRRGLRPQSKSGADGFMRGNSSIPRNSNFGSGRKPLRPPVIGRNESETNENNISESTGDIGQTNTATSHPIQKNGGSRQPTVDISADSKAIQFSRSNKNTDVSYRPASRIGKLYQGSGYQPALPSGQIIPPANEYEIPAQIVDEALGHKSPGRVWFQMALRDAELVAKDKINLGTAIRRLETSLKTATQLNSKANESVRTRIKRAFHVAAAPNNDPVLTFVKIMVPDSKAPERYSTLRWLLSKDATHPVTADLLRHWLGGSAQTVMPNVNWVRAQGAVRASEAKNEKRFKDWLISAGERDKTSPIDPQVLISLPEDKVHTQSTHWISMFDHREDDQMDETNPPSIKPLEDFVLASGTSNIRSEGTLKFTRRGDLVFFEGTVTHNWKDDFDWDKGKNLIPGIPFLPEQTEFIQPLSKANVGKRFEIEARWQRKLAGTLRIKNGQLSIEDIRWGDVQSSLGQDFR